MFDFNISENHRELYDETNEKILDNINIDAPKSLEIDDFAALGAKSYASTSNIENKQKNLG